jgi:hypothetical protein
MQAKVLREKDIGPDSADTAAAYNNLACALIKLERSSEAFKLLKLAEAILQRELGMHHERTLTVKRNLGKALKSGLDLQVVQRPMWQFFYDDQTSMIGKGGVKVEKKVVKGGKGGKK